jgi:quercetin dioxygenase-like cupin family protein
VTTTAVIHVSASDAPLGARGENEHVRSPNTSLNHWALEPLPRSAVHANDYDMSIYVLAGQLDVFPVGGDDLNVAAGDSVFVPAGTDYSMSADRVELIEIRNPA